MSQLPRFWGITRAREERKRHEPGSVLACYRPPALTGCRTRAMIRAFDIVGRIIRYFFLMRYTFLRTALILLLFDRLELFGQTQPPELPDFADISRSAGLVNSHISTPEKKYMVESMSGGMGFIDCDNDGKLDIITVNGSSIDRYREGGDPMITLYH